MHRGYVSEGTRGAANIEVVGDMDRTAPQSDANRLPRLCLLLDGRSSRHALRHHLWAILGLLYRIGASVAELATAIRVPNG